MKLALCMPTVDPRLLVEAASIAQKNARGPLELVVLGNGCLLPSLTWRHRITYITVPENVGVPRALTRLATSAPSELDVLAFCHDDLFILDHGWDERVLAAFEDPKVGLVGFGGSTGLGADDIYKAPYELHQLGRRDFWSNMDGAEIHGQRTVEERPIVFTDGFSMIVRRSLIDKIGAWSKMPEWAVHYGYDCFIACMARRHGFTARLVPCHVRHGDAEGWGAASRNQENYRALADEYGGDRKVHDDVHAWLYEEFKDVLPLRLPS